MPAATRRVCDFPDCTNGEPDEDGNPTLYVTAEGLATRQDVSTDLTNHVFRAHELPLRHSEAVVAKLVAETEKVKAETAQVLTERAVDEPAAPVAPQPVLAQPGHGNMDRRDRMPRPQIDEGVSQSDWNFFKSQWSRYVMGTGLTGQSVVLHLWKACSEPLQRSLHHAGAGAEVDPVVLLDTIK